MNYKLIAETNGVRIQVRYEIKDAFAVMLGGELVPELEFSDTLKAVPALSGSYCGENRFNPVAQTLQFTISAGCELSVVPRSIIKASIRM